MAFLNEEILYDLQRIRSAKALNSKGNEVTKKMFLLGENKCTLSEVSAKRTVTGKPMFEFTFKQNPRTVFGKSLDFAPLKHIIFYPSPHLFELSLAFGHTLKEKPPDYPERDYLNAIFRRFQTFVGMQVSLWVNYRKILSRDKYNRPMIDDNPVNRITEAIVIERAEVAGYGKHEYDWSKAVLPLDGKDLEDFNLIQEKYKIE